MEDTRSDVGMEGSRGWGCSLTKMKSRFVTTEWGLAVIPIISGTWSGCGWIVWVCTDQEDAAEKSRQVQYMYCIYRAASLVVVWLGNEEDDSDFVLRAMAFVGSRKNRVVIMSRDHTRVLGAAWESHQGDGNLAPAAMVLPQLGTTRDRGCA